MKLIDKDTPKVKKMTPAEFIKYAADNHIEINIPEDNRKFPGQQCQDEELNKKFRELHKYLVDQVINFCKCNNIVIDEFCLNADGLAESIPYGSWQSCTDSGLTFEKFTDEYKDAISMKHYYSKPEFELIKLKQEPYLFSM